MDHYLRTVLTLNCSKLNVDKSCFKCDKNSTDYAPTDEEYTLKDEFINDGILSNISAEEREFINVIKGSMLEENIEYTNFKIIISIR